MRLQVTIRADLGVAHRRHQPVADAFSARRVGLIAAHAQEVIQRFGRAAITDRAVLLPIALPEIAEVAVTAVDLVLPNGVVAGCLAVAYSWLLDGKPG